MFHADAIGTPLTRTATKVMLLGSGELSKELAISFSRLGIEVHAVDRTPGAPAQQVANKAHVVDVTDPEAVTRLIREVGPDFIVPEIETIAADVLDAVERGQFAMVAPSAKATALSRNREGIRKLAAEGLGLPTTTYRFVSDYTEFEIAIGGIGYPCVAKPDLDGPGSKHHWLIESEDDVPRAWEYLSGGEDTARVLVERVVDFDYEVTLLAVRSIDPGTGKLATWFCEPIGQTYVAGEYVESWQPMAMSERALENARSVAARVCNELGGRGVYSVKLFVDDDDVYFSEVIPRPHDTGLVTLCSQRYSQFDLHARAVLGLPIDVTLVSPGASSALLSEVDAPAVSFSGLGEALSVPEATVELFGKAPARIGRRMGVALATGEDIATALERAQAAAAAISVVAAD